MILFEGEVKIKLNRHDFMGDGITLYFPEFLIFLNTANRYTLQLKEGVVGTAFESVSDAYIAAQVKLGRMELKDGMYVWKE